ncbi:MarR family winged helix-turn-helix transcriptional regulator [Pseudorhodoferax sp. Leaf267]|uniref:MarR family winged helix-turn-helix transcriptional regulator n=1 Tax=Pseudorhodoferax sp. Leaf267 TaxID=1736316 RepID=UPI0006F3C0F0|nr:MarR family winged helix-turn-helix transcriptional regulator [Pseudorhodoferax sp. Leaf267]KQP14718.1 MarR family transcriptional regulator [Pseudorhodoferax sp. Leaf267]
MTKAARNSAEPQGCTNLQLRQLMRRVAQLYDAELGKAGLKTTQFSLLTAVEKLGPVQPGALARTLGLQASTLTRNLKPLVASGLLELGPGADGRSRLVAITEAGLARRHEAKRRWKTAQLALNGVLGVERVVALHALIQESLALLAPVPMEEETDAL